MIPALADEQRMLEPTAYSMKELKSAALADQSLVNALTSVLG